MQLTARQRQFTRIAGWALPVSVILGAVFGHFNSAPNNSVWPYIQGAIAGILISAAILSLEFVVFGRTVSALARRVPFLLYLALRSLGYPPRSSWVSPSAHGSCGNPPRASL